MTIMGSRPAVLALVAMLSSLVLGCEKEEPKGPAEQFGEKVDRAVQNTGEAVEKAGEDLQKKAE